MGVETTWVGWPTKGETGAGVEVVCLGEEPEGAGAAPGSVPVELDVLVKAVPPVPPPVLVLPSVLVVLVVLVPLVAFGPEDPVVPPLLPGWIWPELFWPGPPPFWPEPLPGAVPPPWPVAPGGAGEFTGAAGTCIIIIGIIGCSGVGLSAGSCPSCTLSMFSMFCTLAGVHGPTDEPAHGAPVSGGGKPCAGTTLAVIWFHRSCWPGANVFPVPTPLNLALKSAGAVLGTFHKSCWPGANAFPPTALNLVLKSSGGGRFCAFCRSSGPPKSCCILMACCSVATIVPSGSWTGPLANVWLSLAAMGSV